MQTLKFKNGLTIVSYNQCDQEPMSQSCSKAILCRNKGLWLVKNSHRAWNSQSRCLISARKFKICLWHQLQCPILLTICARNIWLYSRTDLKFQFCVCQKSLFFKNESTRASFCLFSSFTNTNFTEKSVGVSSIRTWIIGVEGELADHLNTTTAPKRVYALFLEWS